MQVVFLSLIVISEGVQACKMLIKWRWSLYDPINSISKEEHLFGYYNISLIQTKSFSKNRFISTPWLMNKTSYKPVPDKQQIEMTEASLFFTMMKTHYSKLSFCYSCFQKDQLPQMTSQVVGSIDNDVKFIAVWFFCKIGFVYSIVPLKPFGNWKARKIFR